MAEYCSQLGSKAEERQLEDDAEDAEAETDGGKDSDSACYRHFVRTSENVPSGKWCLSFRLLDVYREAVVSIGLASNSCGCLNNVRHPLHR